MKIYQVDAFTDRVFGGNPAAVCVMDEYPADELMQMIANENNLAETAFVVKKGQDFEIRWFTPTVEVDLCGHATLASAYVLFEYFNYKEEEIIFSSKSGLLSVKKEGEYISLNFPSDNYHPASLSSIMIEALGEKPIEVYKGKTDYLLIYSSQEEIEKINPDFNLLKKIDARGIIVSSRGKDVDFVSRFFAPNVGVNEDPVIGSAHTTLIPYWSKTLNKKELIAKQLSSRQGYIKGEDLGKRVKISGKATTYMIGDIQSF